MLEQLKKHNIINYNQYRKNPKNWAPQNKLIILTFEQDGFTMDKCQKCVQKMQTEWQTV